ncbi:MAG: maltokinase N-terminal cap-like domain-containing protein [Marmoricola sp.]
MTREEALTAFLGGARWFGGKDSDFAITEVTELPLGVYLVEVGRTDGGRDVYQVPLSSYPEPQDRLAHALVGEWDDRFWYDAVHDREHLSTWLEAFDRAVGEAGATRVQPLAFHLLPGHRLDLTTHSTLYSGEQSNSSVAFGEDSLMKVFRRVTRGVNPDIEIHEALTRAGSEHVAHLYGWLEVETDDEPVQLAMLEQFLRTATDGWDIALASVRNLFAEADLHAEEVGGDFAGESHRLGRAVAEVHASLRDHFPTGTLPAVEVAGRMRERLERAATEHPAIAGHVEAVSAAFDVLATTAVGLQVQRIHGDLHLGQTLRTSLGWKLVDFEGEPAKPLAERMLPDSPWRDVAGMLRSLDYAVRTVTRDFDVEDEALVQLAYRGDEWVERNRTAFLDGYAEATGGLSEADYRVIAAYELDKAVYEVGYEARNRPAWMDIPLAALDQATRPAEESP